LLIYLMERNSSPQGAPKDLKSLARELLALIWLFRDEVHGGLPQGGRDGRRKD
jgi:hypothetical protein